MSDDWNWHNEDGRESTVIRPVRAMAVYSNLGGDIVIRQEGDADPTQPYGKADDSFVVIPRERAPDIINAIMAELEAPQG